MMSEVNFEDLLRAIKKIKGENSDEEVTLTRSDLEAFFRKERPDITEEELNSDIQQFRLSRQETVRQQIRSDYNQKMLVYRTHLMNREIWGLEHACRLILSPLDFKRIGWHVWSKGADFSIDVKLAKKDPSTQGVDGHRKILMRYMTQAMAGIRAVSEREGNSAVTPADFLNWCEKAGYAERIPHEITQNIFVSSTSGKDSSEIPATSSDNTLHFDKRTKQWELKFEGKTSHVPHREGIRHIATLIENPDTPIWLKDLEGDETGHQLPEGIWESDNSTIDEKALQKEAQALIADKERAEREGNTIEAKEAQDRLDSLMKHIEDLIMAKSKRSRKKNQTDKNRRNRIGKRIESAVEHFAQYDSSFGEHLEKSICEIRSSAPVYRPAKGIEITVLR